MSAEPAFYILSPDHFYELSSARHKRYLPFYERIKTRDEWLQSGFKISVDEYGHVKRNSGAAAARFSKIILLKEADREAIATGKRRYPGFHTLLDYARMGVAFSEFTSHPEHAEQYCLGSLADESDRLEDALHHFKAATDGDSKEVRYLEAFFRIRLALDDMSAINDEMSAFANDIDTLYHSGRVDAWLSALIGAKDYRRAAEVVRDVDALFVRSRAGAYQSGSYAGKSASFVEYKHDKFRQQIVKWSNSKRYAPLVKELTEVGYMQGLAGSLNGAAQ